MQTWRNAFFREQNDNLQVVAARDQHVVSVRIYRRNQALHDVDSDEIASQGIVHVQQDRGTATNDVHAFVSRAIDEGNHHGSLFDVLR